MQYLHCRDLVDPHNFMLYSRYREFHIFKERKLILTAPLSTRVWTGIQHSQEHDKVGLIIYIL